jgi:hypothetical protein
MKATNRTSKGSKTRTNKGRRWLIVGTGLLAAGFVGGVLAPGSASATGAKDNSVVIDTQGYHTSKFFVENRSATNYLVQTSSTVSTSFEEGGRVPANGTVIHTDSSVHYEVVTDRWNGNSASITYDVVSRWGEKVGEVVLNLSVPGSRWNSESRSCEASGAVVCKVDGDVFSVFSGDAREGHPDFDLGDKATRAGG